MEIKIVFDTTGLERMSEQLRKASLLVAHFKYGRRPDDPPASLRERKERGLPCAVEVVKGGCR